MKRYARFKKKVLDTKGRFRYTRNTNHGEIMASSIFDAGTEAGQRWKQYCELKEQAMREKHGRFLLQLFPDATVLQFVPNEETGGSDVVLTMKDGSHKLIDPIGRLVPLT